MAKIFFGCSMRGGYDKVSQKELSRIPEIIEELGHAILSKHQTQENILKQEDELTKTEIFERDYEWLRKADAGVFEITNASTGAGAEIAHISSMNKPVLCLYKESILQPLHHIFSVCRAQNTYQARSNAIHTTPLTMQRR